MLVKCGFSVAGLERIDREMQLMVERGETPGMLGLVYRQGEVAHVTAAGWQDIAGQKPMQRNTIFQIMSMTKPITAAAILTLVDEGKIGLYDRVDEVLPELADMRVLKTRNAELSDTEDCLRPITLADLLTYRAGIAAIPNPVPGIPTSAAETAVGEAYDRFRQDADGWLAALGKVPLETQPGTAWSYGTASEVLTILASRLSGLPYGEFLQKRILGPLGMVDSGHHVPADKQHRFAKPYQRNLETRETELIVGGIFDHYYPPLAPPPFPKGGHSMVSTIDDYLIFARMLLGRGMVNGIRILSHRLASLMVSNFLTDQQRAEIPPPVDSLFKGQGWGLGLSVVVDAGPYDETVGTGSRDTFGWPGAYGTWWQADPHEDMIQIYMHQFLTMSPFDVARQRFQNLGYEAIVE
jgi:CubicO group peptidase (beta-lactamase class C family)